MKNIALTFFFLSLSCVFLNAALNVSLSAKKIGINDTLRVDISYQGGVEVNVYTSDFDLISRPRNSRSIQIVNGKKSVSVEQTLILKPKRTGALTLSVKAGKEVRGPYTISVEKGSVPPPAPEGMEDIKGFGHGFEGRVLVRQKLSSERAMIFEPVVLSTYLYYRTRIGIRGWSGEADMEGLSVTEVENFPSPEKKVKIGSQVYYQKLVRRRILYPNIDGKKVISGDKIRIQEQRGRVSFFASFPEEDIALPPTVLYVYKFPEKNKPESFNGAVGHFKLSVDYDNLRVKAHDPVTVKVQISGSGNFKTLVLPEIDADYKTLQIHKGGVTSDYRISEDGWSGFEYVEYYLFPRKAGHYEIPPVRFSFWSPSRREYVERSAGGFKISASRPDNAEESLVVGVPSGPQEINKDIAFIKPVRLKEKDSAFFTGFYFLFFHVGGLFFALGGWGINRYLNYVDKHESRFKSSRAYRYALARLSKTLKVPDTVTFYKEVENVLHDYITDRFGLPKGLPGEEIKRHLRDRGEFTEEASGVLDFIKHCQAYRYAPSKGSVSKERTADEIKDALKRCEEKIQI